MHVMRTRLQPDPRTRRRTMLEPEGAPHHLPREYTDVHRGWEGGRAGDTCWQADGEVQEEGVHKGVGLVGLVRERV